MTARILLLVSGAVLLLLAGCGGGDGSTPLPPLDSEPPPEATAPAAAECFTDGGGEAVEVVDFDYEPRAATVELGGTVTWTNGGSEPHTVTFDGDGPDCGTLPPEATVSLTFDTAGTLFYHCQIHPSMRAEVVVEDPVL